MPTPRPDPGAVLLAHGLAPGAEGFARGDLLAFAEARGWAVSVEPTTRPTPRKRYRALIWQPTEPAGGLLARRSVGRGPTEAAALAAALAGALTRWGAPPVD